jgi:hypothetical protein
MRTQHPPASPPRQHLERERATAVKAFYQDPRYGITRQNDARERENAGQDADSDFHAWYRATYGIEFWSGEDSHLFYDLEA